MTVYTKETALYSTDAIASDIEGAVAIGEGANARSQLVYLQAVEGTTSVADETPLATWIVESGESVASSEDQAPSGLTPVWTIKRPKYQRNYPVLFVSVQSQTVEESENGAGCSYTTPIIDDTNTVIDGGRIIANSITVEKIDVALLRSAILEVSNVLIGESAGTHISTTGSRMSFMNGAKEVAYIDIDPATDESVFYMTRSMVVKDMQFGDGKWKWYKRPNNNMSLKWIG